MDQTSTIREADTRSATRAARLCEAMVRDGVVTGFGYVEAAGRPVQVHLFAQDGTQRALILPQFRACAA